MLAWHYPRYVFDYTMWIPDKSGQPTLVTKPFWFLVAASVTASLDILQCYEVLTEIGLSVHKEYSELTKEYQEHAKEYSPLQKRQ